MTEEVGCDLLVGTVTGGGVVKTGLDGSVDVVARVHVAATVGGRRRCACCSKPCKCEQRGDHGELHLEQGEGVRRR